MILNLFEDFGGEGEILHFAHANAYPIKTYTSFLEGFTKRYHVLGMAQRPVWPESNLEDFDDWEILADDLINQFDKIGLKQVIGAGHSMGAIATLFASVKRPDLFSKIVLIDPVILPEQVYAMLKGMSMEEKAEMNPIMQRALKRKNLWSIKEEAVDYFNSKSFFQGFTESAKRDFIAHGLSQTEDGSFCLTYAREWEAKIYATNPNPWSFLARLKHPCLILRAEHSDVIRNEESWNEIKEKAIGAQCVQIDKAGHLIPQEDPATLYTRITEFLDN